TNNGKGGSILLSYSSAGPLTIGSVAGSAYISGSLHADGQGTGSGGFISISNDQGITMNLTSTVSANSPAGSLGQITLRAGFGSAPIAFTSSNSLIGVMSAV